MILLENNKVNLIVGKISSAKTTLCINVLKDYLKSEKNALYFSTDTKAHHLSKKMHSLWNNVDLSSVKHDKKTLMPTGIKLPSNISFIDDCLKFEDLKATYREYSRFGSKKINLVVIDNLNKMKFKGTEFEELSYYDRVSKVIEALNKFAEENNIAVMATMNLLAIADWEDDSIEGFTSDDDKLGNIILVTRDENEVNVHDNSFDEMRTYKLSNKNLELEIDENVIKFD